MNSKNNQKGRAVNPSPSSPSPVEKQEGELKHLIDRFRSNNNNSHHLINDIDSKLQELWQYDNDGKVDGAEAMKEPYDLMSRFKSELEVQDYVNIRLERVLKFLREAI